MDQHPAPTLPKSILVVGGCGFLGQHIIHSLLHQTTTSPPPKISVIDLNTPKNPHGDVTYHICSITSLTDLQQIISTIKPQVIIHTASVLPSVIPTTDADDVELFTKANVEGTDNLLECAKGEESVEVFVYTSSATILQKKESYMVVEDAVVSEVRINVSRFDPYSSTKGIADTLVLLANDRKPAKEGGLRTCCLRIGGMYGAGDMSLTWPAMEALRLGETRYQIGDGSKHSDFLAVENAAHAHILAMNALLAGIKNPDAPVVDGEAFFITDDNPMSYWAFRRKIWAHAGYIQKSEDTKIISASIVMAVAFILEWLYLIFSLGYKQPKNLRMRKLEWVCLNRTFDTSKAKERLGYAPEVSTDEALKSAVEWALEHQAVMGLSDEKKRM